MALRRFSNVYGMLVYMPGTFLEPGVILNHMTGAWGVLDGGRYPSGTDATIERATSDLTAARFSSHAVPQIMRWKYNKLLSNLNNAFVAACGTEARAPEFLAEVRRSAAVLRRGGDRLRVGGRECAATAGVGHEVRRD